MKRIGFLYEKVYSRENIMHAISNASKGKHDRRIVKKIWDNIDFYINEIQNIIKNKTYTPSPYVILAIHDGTRKKERTIYKPRFYPDQIIHWSVMQQIEPIIMRGMYDLCCASIRGRGLHYASRYIKKHLVDDKKNTKYCLKLDVKKFYPSIDKEILKQKFRAKIKDKDLLELLDIIIDSSEEGVPIGNYTSQWFANFFLQDLDHFIKEELKVKYYVRYMDDMLLFHRNKKELHKIRKKITKFLQNENLVIKENWQLFKTDSRPLDFIGYRFYRGYTTLRDSNFLRIKRRIKKASKKTIITYQDACAMVSYVGWLKHCNSHKFKMKYLYPYIDIQKCKGVIGSEAKNLQFRKTGKIIPHRKYTK